MDNNYTNIININATIKYSLFLIFMYIITNNIFNNFNNIEQYNGVLIICSFSVILYYILDQYFPSCNI